MVTLLTSPLKNIELIWVYDSRIKLNKVGVTRCFLLVNICLQYLNVLTSKNQNITISPYKALLIFF
jgi:hypothetical protein